MRSKMYLVNFFSEADYGLPEGKIFFWESLLYALSNEV